MAAVLSEGLLEYSSDEMLTDRDIGLHPITRVEPSSYTLTNLLPSWFYESVRHIVYLRSSLYDNWDSYGARHISPQAARLAVQILELIVQNDTPKPAIVPSPEGYIQAEWHIGGCDLEIEFESDTSIRVLFEDLRDASRDWEGVLDTDLSRLSSAVAELSRR